MDLTQATQLLTWLDEEHRKDKALLMALQSQSEVQKSQLREQARQLQEIQAALARIESQLPRFEQLETAMQGIRSEFSNLVARQTAEQEGLEEKRIQAERQESEAIARIIRQVQDRVDSLGTYENTIAVLHDEDSKLRSKVTEAFEQITELSKHMAVQSPRIGQLEQEVSVIRDALAANRLALEDLNSKQMQTKAALDTLAPRFDTKIEPIQLALEGLIERQRTELDDLQAKLQGQTRSMEALDQRVTSLQAPMARWANQMEEFTEQFERNRKTIYDLRELERQVRQQGKEMLELQRVTAERQRTELREWQDDQARVDEEQNVRLQQVEAWRPRIAETLKALEERLDQNRQDIEACSDELWKAWAAYLQGEIGLMESIIKQRGKS